MPPVIPQLPGEMHMNEQARIDCPECDGLDGSSRRDFLMAVGGTAVTLAALEVVPNRASAQQPAAAEAPARSNTKPAEAFIKELYSGLSDEQKRRVVYDWNHGAGNNNQTPTRQRMYNAAIFG